MTSIDSAAQSEQPAVAKRARLTPEEKALKAKVAAQKKAEAARQKAEAAHKKAEAARRKAEEAEQKKTEKAAAARRKAEEAAQRKVEAAAQKAAKAAHKKAEAARKKTEEKARLVAAQKQEAESDDYFLSRLNAAVTPNNQLASLAALTKGMPKVLKDPFVAKWSRDDLGEGPPPGVGVLRIQAGKSVHRMFLLLADILTRSSSAEAERDFDTRVAAKGSGLKDQILTEFDRLSDLSGGYYVSLYALRQAIPEVPRTAFDEALNDLRRDWVLTLNPAEGRHETVPKEVLEAGIMEQGRLHVYLARRES